MTKRSNVPSPVHTFLEYVHEINFWYSLFLRPMLSVSFRF